MSSTDAASSTPPPPGCLSRLLFWGPPLVILAVAGWTAYVHREDLPGFVNNFGNTASVAGLFVTLFGFWWTIWTVVETKRASLDAERRLSTEVKATRAETRQTVQKISLQLLQAECESTYRLAREMRTAIQDRNWHRVLDKVRDLIEAAVALIHFEILQGQERQDFAVEVDNLRVIAGWIERHRLEHQNHAALPLPDDQMRPVDTVIARVETLRARLQQRILEVPNAR